MPPTCTINLINNTSTELAYVETSPHDPQEVVVKPGEPGKRIVVTDTTPGTMHLVVGSDFIGYSSHESGPDLENKIGYTIQGGELVISSKSEKSVSTYTATIVNRMGNNVSYFFAAEGQSKKGVVPPTGSGTGVSEIVQTVGFVKAVFCEKMYGDTSGNIVSFHWGGTKPMSQDVIAFEERGEIYSSLGPPS